MDLNESNEELVSNDNQMNESLFESLNTTSEETASAMNGDSSAVTPPKAKSALGAGRALSHQLKEVILNLEKYFRKKHSDWRLADITYEIFVATRVSEGSVRKVMNEFKRNHCIKGPKTTKSRPKKFTFNANDKQLIESIITSIYSTNKSPEVQDIYNAIKSEDRISFKDCSKHYFYKLFKEMGFKVNRNKNKWFVERPDITAKRRQTLDKKKNKKAIELSED